MVTLYRPDGRAASEIRRDRFASLRVRFDAVSAEVESELRARAFVVELIALVKRYSGKWELGRRNGFVTAGLSRRTLCARSTRPSM